MKRIICSFIICWLWFGIANAHEGNSGHGNADDHVIIDLPPIFVDPTPPIEDPTPPEIVTPPTMVPMPPELFDSSLMFEGTWKFVTVPHVYFVFQIDEAARVLAFVLNTANGRFSYGLASLGESALTFTSLQGFDKFEAILMQKLGVASLTITECQVSGKTCKSNGSTLQLLKVFR